MPIPVNAFRESKRVCRSVQLQRMEEQTNNDRDDNECKIGNAYRQHRQNRTQDNKANRRHDDDTRKEVEPMNGMKQ